MAETADTIAADTLATNGAGTDGAAIAVTRRAQGRNGDTGPWIVPFLDGISGAVFTLVVSLVFALALIMPIIGDYWGYYIQNHNSGKSLFDVLGTYRKGYLGGNPRVGQLFLMLAGYSQVHAAVIAVTTYLLTLFSGFYLFTGERLRPDRAAGLLFVLLATGILHTIASRVGHAFFYSPFTTNYFLAVALLLTLFAFVRRFQFRPGFWRWPVVVLLGGLAGLAHETYGPALIGLGLLYLVFVLVWVPRRARNAEVVTTDGGEHAFFRGPVRPRRDYAFTVFSWLAFTLAYVALYFAPGQNKRYSDIKNNGFEDLVANFGERFAKVSDLLFTNAWEAFVLATVLLFVVSRRRGFGTSQAWNAAMLVAAIGIAYTTLASPLVGARMMFAPHAAVALSIASSVYFLRSSRLVAIPAAVAGVWLTSQFLSHATQATWEYKEAFDYQRDIVQAQKMAGQLDVVAPMLDVDFRKNVDFIRREAHVTDPNHRLNRARARYYGVESFRFEEKPE